MGAFKYIKASFEKSYKTRSQDYRNRLQQWRTEPAAYRIENPTNPVRARELGYKAAKDYIVVRVRTKRGKVSRPRATLGRKPAKNRIRENPGKPWQWFAENKARRFHPNLSVINSYWIGEDGSNQYFEVILKNNRVSTPKSLPKPITKTLPKALSKASPKAEPRESAKKPEKA